MNENELKTRLQRDAELFSPSFHEELCSRIMREISMRVEPERRSAPRRFQFQFQHVVLICSSIFIGIGLWSLTQNHLLTNSVPTTQIAIDSNRSGSSMNIRPSQVTLSPNPAPVQAPVSILPRPSVSNVPNGTVYNLSVPKVQSLEELPMDLIPGFGLVHQNHPPEPKLETQPESENQSISNFWNDATEVVRVPVSWMLDE